MPLRNLARDDPPPEMMTPTRTAYPLGSATNCVVCGWSHSGPCPARNCIRRSKFPPAITTSTQWRWMKHILGKQVASGRTDISAATRQTPFTRFTQLTVLVTPGPLRVRSVGVYHRPRDYVLRFIGAYKGGPAQSDAASKPSQQQPETSVATLPAPVGERRTHLGKNDDLALRSSNLPSVGSLQSSSTATGTSSQTAPSGLRDNR